MCKKKHNYVPLIGAILVHFVPNGFSALGNGHWEHSESKWLLGVRIGIGHFGYAVNQKGSWEIPLDEDIHPPEWDVTPNMVVNCWVYMMTTLIT